MREKNSLTVKNRVGYALGDLGGTLTFSIMGSFLTPYYTEAAGLSTAVLTGLYAVLRVWDTISSPLIGAFLDKSFALRKAGSSKYRWWMIRSAPAIFLSAVLMFTAPSFSRGIVQLLLVAVTYLLYSISYAFFNIPFGSMLSSMAGNDTERSQLSSARGIGGQLGMLLPTLLFPFLMERFSNLSAVYGGGVVLCAGLGLVCCLLCCKWTEERYIDTSAPQNGGFQLSDILTVVRKNRLFDALCLQGLFFMTFVSVNGTLGIYMYRDVLGATQLFSIQSLLGLPLSLLVLSVAPRICGRFGIERSVLASQLIASVLYLLTFFVTWQIRSPWLYVVMAAVSFAAAGFTMQMQWGLLGAAVDHNEAVTGKRLDGTIYGFFNFMRRLGQALGATSAVALLGIIGYVPGAESQAESALLGIRILVILLPVAFLLLSWGTFRLLWKAPAPEKRDS